MSPYGYDYSLAPRPSTGWRSRFATVMTVGAIAAISAISGAAVALNLLAGPTPDRSATIVAHALPATVAAAKTVTPVTQQPAIAPANATATVRATSPPAATPAPQPAPAVAAAVEAPPIAHVSDSDLTFTRGYARRHAIQAAAEAASRVTSESPKTELARVETQGQFGRAAKAKPKAVAHTNTSPEQRRVAEAGEPGGPFSRFGQPERFDFSRHQALAFGDPRDPRANRRPPPQGGGLFGNSPSGFFGGLF